MGSKLNYSRGSSALCFPGSISPGFSTYRLKNGKAEAAYLTVDRLNDGNNYIVKDGLAVGDTIISEGVGLLKEGMSVTSKTDKK